MKTKGARLTTEISLPGRFLVYVPNGEGLGVSPARRRRADAAQGHPQGDRASTGGVIVRTAADGASAEDIERDLVFLERLWKTIQTRAKAATGPELVYQEAELPRGSSATSSPATSWRPTSTRTARTSASSGT